MISTSVTHDATGEVYGVNSHKVTIAKWCLSHSLTSDELDRLNSVPVDYPPDEIETEMLEELRCILADRKLATMPELTKNQIELAKFAFDTGLIPVVRQDVD